jgi:hypothetical protein
MKTTETLTFTAVANGTVSLFIDDKVCGIAVCYVLNPLSMISRIATGAHKRSNIAGHRNLQRHDEHCGGVRHALLRLPAMPAWSRSVCVVAVDRAAALVYRHALQFCKRDGSQSFCACSQSSQAVCSPVSHSAECRLLTEYGRCSGVVHRICCRWLRQRSFGMARRFPAGAPFKGGKPRTR